MTDYAKAMRQAAAHIRKNPERFAFSSSNPPVNGCTACAIGWLGHAIGFETEKIGPGNYIFIGSRGGYLFEEIPAPILARLDQSLAEPIHGEGRPDLDFYNHLERCQPGWMGSAQLTALALEQLADEIDAGDLTDARRIIAEAIAADLPQVVA